MTQKLNIKLFSLIFITLIVFSVGIYWGLPYAISPETVEPWGVDTIAPLQPLNEAFYKFSRQGNEWAWYPLFHFMVLDVFYAPYVAYQYLMGNFDQPSAEFPYGVKNPISFFRDLTLIARLVSLVMAIGIMISVFKITEELFSTQAAFWAALITVFSAPLVFYSKSSNLDVPYLFWAFLAFWQYAKIVKTQKLKHYVFFSIFVALSVATKDQAYGFFILVPFAIIYQKAKYDSNNEISLKFLGKVVISKPILISLFLTITVYTIANNLIFGGWEGLINRLFRYNELISFKRAHTVDVYSFHHQVSIFFQVIIMMVQTLGFGSLLLCCAGIFENLQKKNWAALSIIIFSISYYVFILAHLITVHVRYTLGFSLILSPFAGYFIAKYLGKTGIIKKLILTGVVISLLIQVILTLNLSITLLKDSRYQAERWIKSNISEGSVIESNVKEKFLPHITDQYQVRVTAVNEYNELIPDQLNSDSLRLRNPDYLLVIKGLGVSGDPETIDDQKIKQYFQDLIDDKLEYSVIASFRTPNLFSFRQVVATGPSCFILKKMK
jgi:hypothetical protein